MQSSSGSSTSSSSDQNDPSFLTWLLNSANHQWHLRITDAFLEDDFNYAELPYKFIDFEDCLDLLLGVAPTRREEREWEESIGEAFILYDLLHQRYLATKPAQLEMYARWQRGDYGACPRFYCQSQTVMPTGASSIVNQAPLALYCPRCQDVYEAPLKWDGVAWGPWNHHLMLASLRETLKKDRNAIMNDPPAWARGKEGWQVYARRLFGFRVHPGSPLAPRCPDLRTEPPWPYQ